MASQKKITFRFSCLSTRNHRKFVGVVAILTSREHREQYHPAGPQVRRLCVVLLPDQDLRRQVGQGAAAALQEALATFVAEHGGHAEVRDLEHVAVGQ